MIVVVDDDTILLNILGTLLKAEGHKARLFTSARAALSYLAKSPPPELVISDVVMPEMDGFAFRKGFEGIFPGAGVPFIFLSSMTDEESVVRGLSEGADDYLTKPVTPSIFRAKVGAILRRQKRSSMPVFRGDLSKLPFPQLFTFCENKGLTGRVTIQGEEVDTVLEFRGGELNYGATFEMDETLEQLYALKEGVFFISQYVADFEEIRSSQVTQPVESEATPLTEKPMGLLSGVKVGDRLVQIQTEYSSAPHPQVVTIVVYGGKTIHKRVSDDLLISTREGVEALIKQQHQAVEEQIREKLLKSSKPEEQSQAPETEVVEEPGPLEEGPSEFEQLFDEGLERYMAGDLVEAREIWTRARALDPGHKLLNINLGVLEKKLKNSPH